MSEFPPLTAISAPVAARGASTRWSAGPSEIFHAVHATQLMRSAQALKGVDRRVLCEQRAGLVMCVPCFVARTDGELNEEPGPPVIRMRMRNRARGVGCDRVMSRGRDKVSKN